MDNADRTASHDSLVAIPDNLRFAVAEWIAELIRQACEDTRSEELAAAILKAVHLHDAFLAGRLTAAQTADLAAGAAGWLEPRWPTDLAGVQEVQRLIAATRDLLELRDRALAAASQGDPRPVVVGRELREVLRVQTLLVLEANSHRFDDIHARDPARLLEAAAVFRDAIAVLDTVGWLPTAQTADTEVVLTRGHLAHLEGRMTEVEQTIADRRKAREGLAEPEQLAEADIAIAEDAGTVNALQRILRAALPKL